MKHLSHIAALVRTLNQSSAFHALVIESAPGWAKSTTIERVLGELGISYSSIGSYSTPLYLYNALASATNPMVVIDDCAGIFGDPIAMSILKAATWSSGGGDRHVSWGSTSDRVATPSFVFAGKVILLTNSLHRDRETESFLSRTLYYKISFGPDQIREMLREAAQFGAVYKDSVLAAEVSEFLNSYLHRCDYEKINLRTLQMGYEVARSNPDTWRSLLPQLLPKVSVTEIVSSLNDGTASVEDQAREFMRLTGMTRRSFFNHRRRLGLAKGAIDVSTDEEGKSATFTGVDAPLRGMAVPGT